MLSDVLGDVADVTFESLMPLPKRVRKQNGGRKRTKPPSYEVTSDETMEFVRCRSKTPNSGKKSRPKGKKAYSSETVNTTETSAANNNTAENQPKPKRKQANRRKISRSKVVGSTSHDSAEDKTPCVFCHVQYGDSTDRLKHDIWMACSKCNKWFHSRCAEKDGSPGR